MSYLCRRPIYRPLLAPIRVPLRIWIVHAVDALLALAFAESAFATKALSISFASASESGLAVGLSSIFPFAFARVGGWNVHC